MSKAPSFFLLFRPQPPGADETEKFKEYAFDYGSFDFEAARQPVFFVPMRERRSNVCVETALFCFDLSATITILVYALLAIFQFRLVTKPEWQIVMALVLTLVTLRWYLAIEFRNACVELLFACGVVAEGIGLFCLVHSYVTSAR
ncbi:hypothetical protein QR680_011182 [Steinernema hermaphroditum]|uniref:Uncharacterized protein n=1 Tax=Steinernema hermaphroditum TaxID=289476 RepID=A0AA39IRE9_9BILA|nr:hypothetical protein QR680_011182 [Steinernema hermaphroditum]